MQDGLVTVNDWKNSLAEITLLLAGYGSYCAEQFVDT